MNCIRIGYIHIYAFRIFIRSFSSRTQTYNPSLWSCIERAGEANRSSTGIWLFLMLHCAFSTSFCTWHELMTFRLTRDHVARTRDYNSITMSPHCSEDPRSPLRRKTPRIGHESPDHYPVAFCMKSDIELAIVRGRWDAWNGHCNNMLCKYWIFK